VIRPLDDLRQARYGTFNETSRQENSRDGLTCQPKKCRVELDRSTAAVWITRCVLHNALTVNLVAAARALGGGVSNGQILCPGRNHSQRDRSLAIGFSGDDFVVHSFTGDDTIGCRDYVRELLFLGRWEAGKGNGDQGRLRPTSRDCRSDAESKFPAAMPIWQDCRPVQGTGVERYLRNRGIDIVIPSTIKFHRRLKYAEGEFWPAMVTLATNVSDRLHRTYLEPDTWIKAPVNRPKMMLGPCGSGAVRLRTLGPRVWVSERIETGLTALHRDGRPVWAALSAGGTENWTCREIFGKWWSWRIPERLARRQRELPAANG
jgi:putative DNA primase/helicase